jgi:hypothetical protein
MVLPGGACVVTGAALNMLWLVAREEWRGAPHPSALSRGRAIEFIRRL